MPSILPGVRVEDDGRAVHLVRRKFGPARTWALRLLRIGPDLRLNLDPLGSAVWRLIDGERTARDVLEALEAQHAGEKQLPARLGSYLSTLAREGFITMEGARRRP